MFPLLAGKEFDLTGYAVALTFVRAFGLVKAGTDLAAHPGGGCPHRRLRSGRGVADD